MDLSGFVAEVLKGFGEFGDGFIGIPVFDTVADAVFEVSFENDLSEFVKGAFGGVDLNQDLFAGDVSVDHFIDGIELSDNLVHSAVQIFRIHTLTHCFHLVSFSEIPYRRVFRLSREKREEWRKNPSGGKNAGNGAIVFPEERRRHDMKAMGEITSHYSSPLGGITLAGEGEWLTGLWFDGQKHFAETLSAEQEEGVLPVLEEAKAWLDRYFQGRDPGKFPLLRPSGSPFRLAVWEILRQIPRGSVVSYGWIAAELARKRGGIRISARAVGGAVGHNPISILIPCHRVVGSDGKLTGYAGGIERKIRLLSLEGVDPENLRTPPLPLPHCKTMESRRSGMPERR